MKKILPFALISALASANDHIKLPEYANGKLMMTDTSTVFVAGNGEIASLHKIDLKSKQATALVLPEKPIMYSLGKLKNHDETQAFVLTTKGIFHVNEQTTSMLVATSTLYTDDTFSQFEHQAFSLDVNGDELTDFYLPGIAHQTLYIQQDTGKFETLTIPLKAMSKTGVSGGQLTVSHTLPQMPTLTDVNGDGKADLVFYDKQAIQFFLRTDNGLSKERQTLLAFDSNDKQKFLKLEDVNNDGYLDVLTKENISDNKDGEADFDSESIRRVFFARPINGTLKYNQPPDIELTLDGASSIADLSDFDGDGVNDLALISFDIGFTDVISIASAAMKNKPIELDSEIAILKGLNDNKFSKKALTSKDFEIAVNMDESNDGAGYGVIFKDFNGDGLTDLMVKTDSDELKVYFGDKKRGLSRKAKRIKRKLPHSNRDIYSQDINQDGAEDIVLKVKDDKGGYQVELIHIK